MVANLGTHRHGSVPRHDCVIYRQSRISGVMLDSDRAEPHFRPFVFGESESLLLGYHYTSRLARGRTSWQDA